MKRSIVTIFTVAMIALSLAACGSSGGGGGGGTTTTALKGLADCTTVASEAVICGTVYAADGTTPVIGATVAMNTASTSTSLKGLYKGIASDTACQTDTSGQFACSGISESGSTTFTVTSDVGVLTFTETVTVGSTTNIAASETTMSGSESTVSWLVLPGAYDGVQLLLSQLKGCTLTGNVAIPSALTGSDECETAGLFVLTFLEIDTTFSDVANLTAYDSIFVNCDTDMTAYATVLQQYVAQGGNLYFSDLADDGLTAAFPGNVNYDTTLTSTGTVTSDVDNAGLATFLGSSTVDIEFDLSSWQSIGSVESNVTTYISGDTSALGGSTDAPITVGWKESTGGCVFYTSYHIEGASSGSDQELALKYLVLNISQVCN